MAILCGSNCTRYRGGVLTVAIFLFLGYGKAQWVQDKFVIGSFIDPPAPKSYSDTTAYIERLTTFKNAYFNLLTGMDISYTDSAMYEKLPILQRLGLKTLMVNAESLKVRFDQLHGSPWVSFTKLLDAKRREAFYGYNIFDEVGPEMSNQIKQWIGFLRSKDPNKLAFINFLPLYAFKSKTEYESYLDLYLNERDRDRGPGVVCYDFYPFVSGKMRPDYFYNLRVLREKSLGRPLWYYILTTEHDSYNDITPYQLNFMAFAPLIYGAKGALYFTYRTIENSKTGYVFKDAIIGTNGKPSSKYEYVRDINGFLQKVVGPMVMKSEYIGTYHVSSFPYGENVDQSEAFGEKTPLVSGISNENVSIGVFKDGKDYNVLIFNKSSNEQRKVYFRLRGNHTGRLTLSDNYDNLIHSPDYFTDLAARYNKESNETGCFIDLKPGEIRMLKVRNVKDPFERVVSAKDISISTYPNPFQKRCAIEYYLKEYSNVTLKVVSIDGTLESTILRSISLPPGKYINFFVPNSLKKGTYVVSLQVNDNKFSKIVVFT